MLDPQTLPQCAADALARLRERRPRIHCLMNTVVQKLVADGVTALGTIPSMTSSVEEIGEFAQRAEALLVNLGTLDADRRAANLIAVETMKARGKPWVLDPVKCDFSAVRMDFARTMAVQKPTVIRGNHGEIQALGDVGHSLVVETGKADRIHGNGRNMMIANGHPWMALATGTGCMSGGAIAAFLTVEADPAVAAASAMLVVGVAAEIAAAESRGPGTFEPALLDALANMDEADIVSRARIGYAED
ncbi:MAG: hydroxyethylthiazole kinase [Phyllobacterium sp.]